MNAFAVVLLSGVVGNACGHYAQRQAPYNVGPNDPYLAVASPNYFGEPSQRLFWSQGSNQVGGPGLWGTLTNKFPFLANMFGRMELPTEYGAPVPNSQYGAPTTNSQYGAPTPNSQYFAPVPNSQYYQTPQFFQPQPYQQPQQLYSQPFPAFRQRFAPVGRDVGFTDDAVIVTPPQVPIAPQPAPIPQPAPLPVPEPTPGDGYHYNKPQYRLELPRK